MKLTRRKVVLGAAALVVATGAVVQWVWHPFGGRPWRGQAHQVALDFAAPDALIDSESLSRLPRDMLRVPLLRDVLSEDFVNYYEDNEGRLSVAGALRRIAFEHDLDWTEALLQRAFDEPARVMLWRGPDGTLRYWALAMQRNGLAKVLQALATVAPGDSQLSRVGEVGGAPLYALRLNAARSLLVAGKGERLVVLSEAGMLLDAESQPIGARAGAVAAWLGDDAGARETPARTFALEPAGARFSGHRLVVGTNYLSFGYQTFFPAIEALRFDFPGGADNKPGGRADWHSAALVDGARLPERWNTAALWQALPADPAACATLPVDWPAAGKMLQAIGGEAGLAAQRGEENQEKGLATRIGEAFSGPAAVCWYGKSGLAAPLFAARLKSPQAAAALRPLLGALFAQVIGAHEPKADGGDGTYRRLPVQHREEAGASVWTRPVSSPYGTQRTKGSPFATQLAAGAYFPVTLALAGDTVLFSPDATLVEDALAVAAKRFPAAADSMPRELLARTVLGFTPSTLASLARREATDALPAEQEAVFLNAARAHLFPKLKMLSAYPAVSLVLPDGLPAQRGWVPVAWRQAGPSPAGAAAPVGPPGQEGEQ
ncbi:DUF2138 domain-containing protein [Cupriavidus malaysiensis]|uniref:DUF2138 domain-containing protein n=1 Tax=Cupriavidus malaysiensis TaxID=367825 RepID=A0ABN4TRR6_9BURK|nr:DUF2138 domain-containing protein [Cupriavidus malaysiensis]AOZ09927.1 hypothetical protein BKK80_30080 [Cupriavidus malaysiensis]